MCLPIVTNLARTIPRIDKEFTLKKYKEGLGKSYSRITIFLAPGPEIGDIGVPNANLSDTEFETFENTDELFKDDTESFPAMVTYLLLSPVP